MSAGIVALTGTAAGHQLALALALFAAVLHAAFGALQKGRHDPWVSRAAIDGSYGLMSLPLALFLVPPPSPRLWLILAGAFVIHVGYKLMQAAAYSRGAYTVVYPVVRGTGPLFTVIGATFIFAERYTPLQWGGVAMLVGGIFGLAWYNLRHVAIDRESLAPALKLAFLTGGFVALYTTYDAYGIRAATDPFTFLAWFFTIDGIFMPLYTWKRLRRLPRHELLPLARRGVFGAIVAWASFGSIMMATRIDTVGRAAVLRETSTVFAAIIGYVFLKETVGPRRLLLMALIAAGAVVVEIGG